MINRFPPTHVKSGSLNAQKNTIPNTRAPSPTIDFSKYLPSTDKDTFISSRKDFTHLLIETSPNSRKDIIRPCKLISGSYHNVVVSHSLAIKTLKQPERYAEYYPKWQQKEQSVRNKLRSSNEEISLTTNIYPLEGQTFSTFDPKTGQFTPLQGPGSIEEAFLGDCYDLKLSNKQELFSFFACISHQMDALHTAHITHMDIKAENTCKTKNSLFKVIDLDRSLDFTDSHVKDEIQKTNFSIYRESTPPDLFHRLQRAPTLEESERLAKQIDIFATGSLFYQMTHAFKNNQSAGDYSSFPYELKRQEFYNIASDRLLSYGEAPSTFKAKEELDDTLSIIDDQNQRTLIKKMLSLNSVEQPTAKTLKEIFPTSLIIPKESFSTSVEKEAKNNQGSSILEIPKIKKQKLNTLLKE